MHEAHIAGTEIKPCLEELHNGMGSGNTHDFNSIDYRFNEPENIKFTDTEKFSTRIKQGTSYYLSAEDWDYFVTLTFNRPLTKIGSEAIILKFVKSLDNELFGKRSKKALKQVCIVESHANEGFHLHMLLVLPFDQMTERRLEKLCPSSSVQKDQEQELKRLVRDTWENIDKSTGRISDSCRDGRSWFKKIHDQGGISNYSTKQMTYGRYDVIPWHCSNPTGRRPAN